VWYPGLRTHEKHELACRQKDGFGAMVTFELKGGKRDGEILMDPVKLLTPPVSLGDVDSVIEHPASTTQSTYDADKLASVRIAEGMVRLSVGLEDVEDIIEDLSQALKRASDSIRQ